MKIKDRNKNTNVVYRKVYRIWKGMMDRCYDINNERYKTHGGVGVKVINKWHTLDNFINDVDKIDGFDLTKLKAGKLSLDKDGVKLGNKMYGPGKVRFVSVAENNSIKPNQQREFIAVSPDGRKYNVTNQSQFARDNKLLQTGINNALTGRAKSHKGWTFEYKK